MAMTDTLAEFGTCDWLPASVQRAQAAEDQQERREARRAEAEREGHAEAARDQATAAYMAAAASRGEDVTAMDAVNGNIGRTVSEVLAGNAGLADRIPKEHREPVNFIDAPVRRSAPVDGDVDGDGVLPRAMLAAEARRVGRRGQEAREAMDAAQARRRPPTLADAWASWRRR
jgi:hypothetical protein